MKDAWMQDEVALSRLVRTFVHLSWALFLGGVALILLAHDRAGVALAASPLPLLAGLILKLSLKKSNPPAVSHPPLFSTWGLFVVVRNEIYAPNIYPDRAPKMTDTQLSCPTCEVPIDFGNPVCPVCGRQDLVVHVHDTARCLEEIDLLARDNEGNLRRELASRTDGNKEGVIDIDRTGSDVTVRRSGTRLGKLDNLEDENLSVVALTAALNSRDGSAYQPQTKETEDSDVPDVWILDEQRQATDPDRRVGVQVTHLDRDAIAALGSKEEFDLPGAAIDIARAAGTSIAKKQNVDPVLLRKTFLLLICPYPISESIQQEIRERIQAICPNNLYRETWVASLREPPFRVQ